MTALNNAFVYIWEMRAQELETDKIRIEKYDHLIII